MVAQAVTAVTYQGLPSIGPALRDGLGLSVAEVGYLLSTVQLGMTLGLVPLGTLTDRVGDRIVMTVGLAGVAAAFVLATVSGRAVATAGALFLAGIFTAATVTASGTAVVRWFDASERGLAMGLRLAAVPLGAALAAAVLPRLAEGGGPDAAFVAVAVAAAAVAVLTALFLRDAPGARSARRHGALSVLRDGRVRRVLGASLLLACAYGGFVGFTTIYLHEERGFSEAAAAAPLIVLQLGAGLLRVGLGRVSDVARSRLAPLSAVCGAVALGSGATALAIMAPAWVVVAALVTAGMVASSWNALALVATTELGGVERAGSSYGLQLSCVLLGTAFALATFGGLVETVGWATGYVVLAACGLGALLLIRPVRRAEAAGRLRTAEA
jgi:sugar phosphate permease